VDPEPTTTMDNYLTACTGMDALVHALEALVSNAGSALTDLHAQEAVGRIFRYLPQVIEHPRDIAARQQVMFGSLAAGLAFSNASLGAVHAMSHSIGGLFDLPHGECNSLLIEHVIRFNWPQAGHRYAALAGSLELSLEGLASDAACETVINALIGLKQRIGITSTLGDRGIRGEDIPQLARLAVNDPCMATNPIAPTIDDIETVYAQAL